MMKGNRIENVIDSRSLEVNKLANVSAVVSPAGLFLKFIFFVILFLNANMQLIKTLLQQLFLVTVYLILSLMYWWVM